MGAVSRASPTTTLRQAQGRLRAGRRASAGWALSAGRRRRRPFGKLRAGSEPAAGLALDGRCQQGVADDGVELGAGLVYRGGAAGGGGLAPRGAGPVAAPAGGGPPPADAKKQNDPRPRGAPRPPPEVARAAE